MALASFFEPGLPKNEGAYRSVEIRLPEGTLVNARAPAPMTMNTVFVAHEIVHAVWKALGQALPERASAGWSKAVHAVTAGLRDDGGRYVMYQWAGAPAGGGVEGRDGFHLIGHLITLGGLTLPNLETYEQLYPVRFRRQELRCDSAGPGRFRGGAGCDYEVEIFTPADYAFRGEGVGAPSSFGAAGGRAGSGGEVVRPWPTASDPGAEIRRRAAWSRNLSRAVARRRRLWRSQDARPGARPARRARRGGQPGRCQRDYGVAIAADGRSIDEAQTAALRA